MNTRIVIKLWDTSGTKFVIVFCYLWPVHNSKCNISVLEYCTCILPNCFLPLRHEMLTQPFQISYELLLDLCADLPLVHEGVVWLRNIVLSQYLEAQREPYPFRYKGTKKTTIIIYAHYRKDHSPWFNLCSALTVAAIIKNCFDICSFIISVNTGGAKVNLVLEIETLSWINFFMLINNIPILHFCWFLLL